MNLAPNTGIGKTAKRTESLMKLISTRGGFGAGSMPSEAIAQGLCGDGGLFAPLALPKFSSQDIDKMGRMNYADCAALLLAPFLPEFTETELTAFTTAAYQSFPCDAAPVVNLSDGKDIHLLELFHGPTCAFKDFALQLLPHLLSSSTKKVYPGKTAVILAATSGDTGKAALEGFMDVDATKIMVFYPADGISNIQRLQMTTQPGNNLAVIGIEGNFDHAQSGVKGIFADAALSARLADNGYLFSSANSINWGRILPQIVYYFYAYTRLIKSGAIKPGGLINVSVPTGNFGNILAAYYAKKCGLPIHRLICASNRNNVLTDFINTGVYDRNRTFYATTSPSMDIVISSNIERLLFDVYNDSNQIKELMTELSTNGRYSITLEALKVIQSHFYAGFADDEEVAAIIGDCFANQSYLADPHTAVGIKVLRDYRQKTGDNTPAIVAATASPYKFAHSVLAALGIESSKDDDFGDMEALMKKSGIKIPSALFGLKGKHEIFTDVIKPADMKNSLIEWLKI